MNFDRRSQALLGTIAVIVTLSLAVLAIKAAGGAFSDDYELVAVVDRAGFGLDNTSTVKVRGVTIGQVGSLDLQDDGTVEITLKIERGVRVPETVTASVEPLSIFGPKFVDLVPGDGELDGPYLSDGDQMPDGIEPSELIETLDAISTLLKEVDADDISIFFSEVARGVEGLGEEIGTTIDNLGPIAEILQRNRGEIDSLLADAKALAETFENRAPTILAGSRDIQGTLDIIAASDDPLAELLTATDHLSSDLARVLRTSGDDLDRVVAGLDDVTLLLHDQLAQVPDLLEMFEGIFAFVGRDLIQWDIGDGRLGAVVDAVIELDPCVLLAPSPLPGCPTL